MAQLQTSPLLVKNDVKSLPRMQGVRGTLHRNEFLVLLRAGPGILHRRGRGNI